MAFLRPLIAVSLFVFANFSHAIVVGPTEDLDGDFYIGWNNEAMVCAQDGLYPFQVVDETINVTYNITDINQYSFYVAGASNGLHRYKLYRRICGSSLPAEGRMSSFGSLDVHVGQGAFENVNDKLFNLSGPLFAAPDNPFYVSWNIPEEDDLQNNETFYITERVAEVVDHTYYTTQTTVSTTDISGYYWGHKDVAYAQPDHWYSYAACAGQWMNSSTFYCRNETREYRTVKVTDALDENGIFNVTAVGSTPYSASVDRKGDAVVTIPIKVRPGVNNLQPAISVNYNSAGAEAQPNIPTNLRKPYGEGWSLSGFSEIHRCKKGEYSNPVSVGGGYADPMVRPRIQFDNTDSICIDDQKLVLTSGTKWEVGSTYQTEIESFKQITIKALPGKTTSEANEKGLIWFEVKQSDGRIAKYGETDWGRKRLYHGQKYLAWAIQSVKDRYNNEMTFNYIYPITQTGTHHTENTKENYQDRPEENIVRFVPTSIKYPGGRVEFSFGGSSRSITVTPEAAFESRVYHLNSGFSTIQECVGNKCLAPLTFTYYDDLPGNGYITEGKRLYKIKDGVGAETQFEYAAVQPQCLTLADQDGPGYMFTEWPNIRAANDLLLTTNGQHKYARSYKGRDIECRNRPNTYTTEQGMPNGVSVDRILKSDGLGGFSSKSYRYGDPGFNSSTGDGFVGYSQVRVKDDQTGITTYTQYRLAPPYMGMKQAEVVYPNIANGTFNVSDQSISEGSVKPISSVVYYHDVIELVQQRDGNNNPTEVTLYPYVKQSDTRQYKNGQLLSVAHTSKVIELSGNGRFFDTETDSTIISSDVDDTSWLINLEGSTVPERHYSSEIPDNASVVSSNVVTKTYTNYDDWRINFLHRVNATQKNSYPGNASADTKTQTKIFYAQEQTTDVYREYSFPYDEDLSLVTTIERDHAGNVVSTKQTGDHIRDRETLSVGYSNNYGAAGTFGYSRLPQEHVNALGHITRIEDIDPRFDVPTVISGVHGELSYTYYDPFERVVYTKDPAENETIISYVLCSSVTDGSCAHANAAYQKVVTSDISPDTKEVYDVLNRVIATYTQGLESTEWIKTETIYNNRGLVAKQSLPYINNSDKRFTTFTYDNLGRKDRATRPDGSYTRWIYDTVMHNNIRHDRTITIDHVLKDDGGFQKTRAKVAYFNAAGQLVLSQDGIDSSSPYSSFSGLNATKSVTTHYKYDALGNPVWVQVNGGSGQVTETTSKYDNAGNRKELTGPNVGTIKSEYTALGELRWTKDAEGNITTYEYDELGRMVQKSSPSDIAIYHYDGNLIGALDSVETLSGYEATYRYDYTLRAPTQVEEKLSGTSRNLTRKTYYTYDAQGRVDTQTYASGITVKNEYSDTGYLEAVYEGTSINSSKLLHRIDAINAFGSDTTTFGNGMKTIMDYDLETGFVKTIEHRTPTGSAMNYQTYKWHSSGNMQERWYKTFNQANSYYKETFTYDNHDRLNYANIYRNGSYQRRLETQYNNIGNITKKISTKTGDDDVTSYTYKTKESGCANTAGPHAVSKATINGVVNHLCYDKNGYITRYTRSGSDKFIEYNTEGQPTLITVGDSITDITPDAMDEFRYNANGQRFYKRSEYKKGSDTQVEEVFYFSDGTEITYYTGDYDYQITEKTYASGNVLLNRRHNYISWDETVQYLHKDHLGSVVAITDESFGSDAVHKLAYEPFGSRRKADWTRQLTKSETDAMLEENGDNSTRGFTGHEHLDRTGFIHMNGRVYDPVLGRFLTPDPLVQRPTLSQNWNRYTYAWNNPLRYTDPTGYSNTSRTNGQVAIDAQRNGIDPDVDQVIELPSATIKLYKNGDVGVIVKKGSESKGTKTDSVAEIGSKVKSWLKEDSSITSRENPTGTNSEASTSDIDNSSSEFPLIAANQTKPQLGSGVESHNGGKEHVHWGKKSNPRANAINKDGTIRHGEKPPKSIKKKINKLFGWDLKGPLFIIPFSPETFEKIIMTPESPEVREYKQYLKDLCNSGQCEA